MTSETRRSIAAMLVGVVAMLAALLTATWLRERACLDAGGRWNEAARACAGAVPASDLRAWAIGALVGVLAALTLWRAYAFATRGRRL